MSEDHGSLVQRRKSAVRRQRARGVPSEVLNIWLDADVKHYADATAKDEGVALSLWVQELIRRDREMRQGGHRAAS